MKCIFKLGILFFLGLLGCQSDPSGGSSILRHDSWEAFEQRHRDSLAEEYPAEISSQTPSLQECQVYAASHNLNLQAAFYRWQAALAEVPQAKALPNPKISYSYFFQRVETRTGSQRQSVALQQAFPAWGKIQSRTDAASAMAKARWQEFQGMKFAVYARVQKEWGQLYYAQKEVSLTQEQLLLLEQFEPILRSRYRTSKAARSDLLRLQVDIGKLRDRLASLRKRLVPLQASLNRVMGRQPSTPIRAAAFPVQPLVTLNRPKARVAVAEQNPYLLASRMKMRAADENINLARAARLPDVTVGVAWIDTAGRSGPNSPNNNGEDPIMGTVSLSLPIWFDAIEAGIRQAQHRRTEVGRRYESLMLDSLTTLEEALFQLEDSQRREVLYRDSLLPKATESWKVTQRQYTDGLSDYNDMIETLQTVLEFGLALQRSQVRRLAAAGALQELTTLSIDELALQEDREAPETKPTPSETP